MITYEEAKRAWETKEPVHYHHPLAIKPIVCTIGRIEASKRFKQLLRVTLRQSANSYIITKPQYVSLANTTKQEHSPELAEALAELGRLKKEGFINDDE